MRRALLLAVTAIIVAAPANGEPRPLDTVPSVRVVSGPPPATSARTAAFRFDSVDGAVSFACGVDGAPVALCSSPASYDALADGTHVFHVDALAAGGVAGASANYSWTVDTTAPKAQLTSAPAASATSAFAEFTFASAEAGVSFACSLDRSAATLCVSPVAYSALAAGAHTFAVTPTDPAGNVGSTLAYTWAVAPTAQAPAVVGGLRAAASYRAVTIGWTPPTATDFDRVVVLRGVDGDPATSAVYQGAGTTYLDGDVDNGRTYRYVVLNIDRSGNASAGVSVVVRPESLLLSPAHGMAVRGPVRLTWTPVRKAVLYNVQLWRGGRKILSAWPKRPRMAISSRWRFGGRSYSLSPGTYQWFVWPGFGRAPRVTYGSVVGQSEFTRVR